MTGRWRRPTRGSRHAAWSGPWRAGLLVGLLAGCAGAPAESGALVPAAGGPGRGAVTPAAVGRPAPDAAGGEVGLPVSPVVLDEELGPGVLMPRADPDDAEVVKVAGFSVRKSHLYDRFFEINPLWTRKEVDWIVFDILLAREARRHKIFVDVPMIEKRVAEAEDVLAARVQADWGGRITLDRFLQENRGISRKVYRALARRQLAREWLRYYVVRYLGSLEDRVQVRILSHRNRARIQKIMEKVADGADFRSLALRESEHPTQRRGGLLPPFGRNSTLKFAAQAFELQPGEVSRILTVESDGVTHYYLLYCVKRIPGRKRPFKEVKAELDRERDGNPLTEEEKLDLYERLRSASESLPKGGRNR